MSAKQIFTKTYLQESLEDRIRKSAKALNGCADAATEKLKARSDWLKENGPRIVVYINDNSIEEHDSESLEGGMKLYLGYDRLGEPGWGLAIREISWKYSPDDHNPADLKRDEDGYPIPTCAVARVRPIASASRKAKINALEQCDTLYVKIAEEVERLLGNYKSNSEE